MGVVPLHIFSTPRKGGRKSVGMFAIPYIALWMVHVAENDLEFRNFTIAHRNPLTWNY